MKSKHLVTGLGLLTIGAVSTPTLAQDAAGWYVSASVGQSNFDVDTAPLSAVGITNISTDDNDTAWKINFGYQFNQNWGVEIGYIDFGKFSLTGTFGGATSTASVDATAITAAAVGTMPLGNGFSLYGKLGAYRIDADATVTIGGRTASAGGDETDIFGGIGVRYNFNPNLSLHLEAEHYNGDDSINVFSIGLQYKF